MLIIDGTAHDVHSIIWTVQRTASACAVQALPQPNAAVIGIHTQHDARAPLSSFRSRATLTLGREHAPASAPGVATGAAAHRL